MTNLKPYYKNKLAVKNRVIFLLAAVFFMTAAFMNGALAHNIQVPHLVFPDTLVSAFSVKTQSPKTRRDSVRREASGTPVFFLPVDPDAGNPPQKMYDTAGSSRARMAMKLYMDSLFIGPKANDQLKKASNNFNREANQPNPGKNFSSEAFRQLILLLAP